MQRNWDACRRICKGIGESLISKSGDRLVFVRLKNGEELYEARLVRLASRAITVWLNPFRVLFAERVVNLVLKLNVRANFVGAARRTVHFHCPR